MIHKEGWPKYTLCGLEMAGRIRATKSRDPEAPECKKCFNIWNKHNKWKMVQDLRRQEEMLERSRHN
jgi:hypothetical protein